MNDRRRDRRNFLILALLPTLLMVPWAASWAQNENETVGFRPGHAFESGQFGENIDILNGGVNLTVPIGQSFRLSPHLETHLSLAYNSKIWNTSDWQNTLLTTTPRVVTSNKSSFGIGFSMNFGRIYYAPERAQSSADPTTNSYPGETAPNHNYTATWRWASPDGAQHEFLFDGAATYNHELNVSAGPVFDRRGTNDLSYTIISGPGHEFCPPSTPSTDTCFRVEMGDGLVYTLEKRVDCLLPGLLGDPSYLQIRMENENFCGWYTTLIEDRTVGALNVGTGSYAASVHITYDGRPGFQHVVQSITDSDGRVIFFHNCEWAQGGHCSNVPAQQCFSDAECSSGVCTHDDSGNPGVVNQCVPGSQDPNSWTASSRSAVATYEVDMPGPGTNTTALDTTKVTRYGFVYERARVKVADPGITALGDPVLKLLRIDYPTYTRAVGGASEAHEYSIYYGYCDMYGAGCGGQPNYMDYGEVVCRTLPLLRRVNGVDQITGDACASGQNVTKIKYQFGYYTYVSAFLSGGHSASKDCYVGGGACPGNGAGSWAVNGITRAMYQKSLSVPTNSPTSGGTWTYTRDVGSVPTPTRVTVTDSSGNDTVYLYHSSPTSTDAVITGKDPDDGLAPEWNDGLDYQIDYFEGSRTTGRLVRSVVYGYDTDFDPYQTGKRAKSNTRKFSTVTRYADDDNKTQSNLSEDWDNVGHWRTETQSSSDATIGMFTKRTYHVPFLAATSDEPNGLYMPGLVEVEEVFDGNRVLRRTDSQYDPTRGTLQTSIARSTPLALGSPQNLIQYPEDVKTTLTYSNTSGNVIAKTMSSANTGQTYQIKYTYGPALGTCPARANSAGELPTVCGGYLATKGFHNGTVVPWKAIDRDRDANTGLIIRTRDTAGVTTDYAYDDLGRIKTITPQGEVATLVDYPTLQETKTSRGTLGTSGYIMADYRYDGLGKVVATGTLPADDTQGYSCKTSRFDAEGRTIFESEPYYDATCNPGATITELGTYYLFTASTGAATDPFGRVRRTVPADATLATGAKVVTTDYFGTSSRQTVRDVAGPSGVLFPAVTTFYHDALGRLVYVDSPAGKKCSLTARVCVSDTQCAGEGTCVTAGGGADASYAYDGLDRLVDVEVGDGTVASQSRTMTYDGLGHLRQESHPENGVTTHTSYDALGNPLEVRDAAGNLQRFVYDFAGRPTQKKIVVTGGTTEKIVVSNTYDSDATQRGSSLGKQIVAQTNDENGSIQLTESQFYQGIGGRLSAVVETFPDWTSGARTAYTYDTLGQLTSIDYPIESPGSHTALTVDYVYSHGVVTKAREHGLSRDLGTVTYKASGAVDTLDTPGLGRSQFTYEDRNRPKMIVTGTWTGSAWSNTYYQSGTYSYDGAGNISGRAPAGSEWESATYGYDASNRLVAATTIYDTPSVNSVTYAETYTYDPFGNMTQHFVGTTPQGSSQTLETTDFDYTLGGSSNNNQIRTVNTSYGAPPGSSTGAVVFSYDARGNVTQGGHRYMVGATVYDETRRYDYDVQNRVEKAYGYAESGGQPYLTELDSYTYDSRGNRIIKKENNSGMKTYFIRDTSGQVLSEFRRPALESGAVIPEWAKDYVSLAGKTLALKENLRPEAPTGLYGYYDPDLQTRTISWRANTEPDLAAYKIYRKRQFQDQSYVYLGQVTGTSYFDNTVQTAGRLIMYHVTAVDSAGYESANSVTLTIVQGDTTAPTIPVLAIAPGDTRLVLTWTTSTDSSGILGYEVDRKDPSGTWRSLTSNLLTGPSYVDLNLANGTAYYYRIRAKDNAGIWGSYSAQVSGVPKDFQPPIPPRGLVTCAAAELTTTVNISWDPNPDSDGPVVYKLYRNSEPRFDGSTPAPLLVQTSSMTSYSDVGLGIGSYYYAVKAVDGATPANESAYSTIQQAATRDPANAPTFAVYAKGHDGAVDVTWPLGLSADAVRVYRRPDATRACYTYVGEIRNVGANTPHTLTDATVNNNRAYDYAVSTVTSGVESAYSKPTLGIPLARAVNLYQCKADNVVFDSSEIGSTVIEWTPPFATAYQPLLATTGDGTFAFLKGYHIYHHTVGGHPNTTPPPCTVDCYRFVDNSKMRRIVASQGDSIDPYLVSMPLLNHIPAKIFDPMYPLQENGSQPTPVDPVWILNVSEPLFHTTEYAREDLEGENCVMPRAVYKVYAQGTWLTAESDWPSYYDNENPDAWNRCGIPIRTFESASPVPYCGSSADDPNYVAPPTNVVASTSGPGAVRVTWTPPTGVGSGNVVGYNVYMFHAVDGHSGEFKTEEAQRPLPFATVDADTTELSITGLKKTLYAYFFAVHSMDSSGRLSFGSGAAYISAIPGLEASDPGAPRSVKAILWSLNDQGPSPRGRSRKGIKLAWQSVPTSGGASLQGFRIYRSTNPSTYGCALLASASQPSPPLPIDADPTPCVTSGAFNANYTAGSSAAYFQDVTAVKGATYYYRVTELTQVGSDPVMETDLSITDQVAVRAPQYDDSVLPPPQGFSAYAPQNGTTDMAGIYLQWCPIPVADTTDNLPSVSEYWVYRTVTKVGNYELLAKLSRDCIENDPTSGHAPRCEIDAAHNCHGNPQSCVAIHRSITCGGTSQLPCAVVDKTLTYWPQTRMTPDGQSAYNYSYRLTAVVSDPATESMPSLVDEGWLNYVDDTPGIYFERRDPEGIPTFKVCGDETVERYDQPGPLEEQAEATGSLAEVVAPSTDEVAPDRIIGQSNPYSPPARFLFYHADHLGSPRVILNDTGQVVALHHYLPFGDERPAGADATLNTRAFTGHERDTETGLDYMMARYYSSSLGRFMATDPAGPTGPAEDPQKWNLYSYALNNPIRSVDPDGRCPIDNPAAADTPRGARAIGSPSLAQRALSAVVGVMASVAHDITTLATGETADGKTASVGQFVVAGANLALAVVGAPEGEGGEALAAAGRSKNVGEMAEELSGSIGKNSVSFETPTESGHIDLQGAPHFDKATGADIATPHVQSQTKHVGPNGEINLSGDVKTRPATKQDVRTARKLEERK
jgi:RHS repeat-associated protein